MEYKRYLNSVREITAVKFRIQFGTKGSNLSEQFQLDAFELYTDEQNYLFKFNAIF